MIIFLVLSLIFALLLLFWQISLIVSIIFGAPMVYATEKAVIESFKLADLKKNETVLDLGCADGQALVLGAKKFGAKGIGIEISPFYFFKAKLNVARSRKSRQIKIIFGNLKKNQEVLPKADVIYLYLFPELLEKIEESIFDQVRKDARVVSVGFKFKNHRVTAQKNIINHGRQTRIYLYRV